MRSQAESRESFAPRSSSHRDLLPDGAGGSGAEHVGKEDDQRAID